MHALSSCSEVIHTAVLIVQPFARRLLLDGAGPAVSDTMSTRSHPTFCHGGLGFKVVLPCWTRVPSTGWLPFDTAHAKVATGNNIN